MSNRYPGYCIDCRAEVPAGHGDFKKVGGFWQITCGGQRAARATQSTATPASSMPLTGGPWAGAHDGVRHEKGVTRRADNCERCGEYLPAGQGRLECDWDYEPVRRVGHLTAEQVASVDATMRLGREAGILAAPEIRK